MRVEAYAESYSIIIRLTYQWTSLKMQKDVDVIVGALAVRTGVQMLTGLWVRVPAHDGHDSGAMADTVPVAWRTVFRLDSGHFRCSTGKVSAMISERCPR